MRGNIIRKILVVLIIFAPVFSYSGCKKQPRCGCGKDALFTLDERQARVYFNDTKTSITFTLLTDPYSTFNFCNPGEMSSKLDDYVVGDILLVSGTAYWECNYLYQSSNYSYQSYMKVYMVEVTDITADSYGKK